MKPTHAARTVRSILLKYLAKRRALNTIQASPASFCSLPSGEGSYKAAIYFADAEINSYQIRQWYEPFVKLNQQVPVVVLVRNPETAVMLRRECPLPLFYAPTIGDVEQMVEAQGLGAVFYVNQNIRNFQMLRFNRMAHVFISHGESEKAYMWSNQLKAYDYVFVAGEAARERLAKNLERFDVVSRTHLIGRPQIDVNYPAPTDMAGSYRTVLYAPTWEGDRPSMAYGSVATHGLKLVDELIASGRYNVIFRPHPRSGVSDPLYGSSVKRIKSMLESAKHSLAGPTYYYDDSPSWGWQWATADLCITDMSAVAYDWLATGKPILISRPANPQAVLDDSPALLKLPSISQQDVTNIVSSVEQLLQMPHPGFQELVDYHFGNTEAGESMKRFIVAAMKVLDTPKTQSA